MKKLSILICLILAVGVVNAQQETKIPKFSNAILVVGTTYDIAVNALLDAGFQIKTRDEKFLTAETEYKRFEWSGGLVSANLSINIRQKDSVLIIRGQWISADTEKKDVEYRGVPASKRFFLTMDEIAKSLHGRIEYKQI